MAASGVLSVAVADGVAFGSRVGAMVFVTMVIVTMAVVFVAMVIVAMAVVFVTMVFGAMVLVNFDGGQGVRKGRSDDACHGDDVLPLGSRGVAFLLEVHRNSVQQTRISLFCMSLFCQLPDLVRTSAWAMPREMAAATEWATAWYRSLVAMAKASA